MDLVTFGVGITTGTGWDTRATGKAKGKAKRKTKGKAKGKLRGKLRASCGVPVQCSCVPQITLRLDIQNQIL